MCACVTGFYCSNERCDHCRPVSNCDPGQGVKVLGGFLLETAKINHHVLPPISCRNKARISFHLAATRTNNTICAQCEEGTYSNVTDFHSQCQVHTRSDCASMITVIIKAEGRWPCLQRFQMLLNHTFVLRSQFVSVLTSHPSHLLEANVNHAL